MSNEAMAWAWKQDAEIPDAKLVLVALADNCDEHCRFKLDPNSLAATALMDREGLIRMLAHLFVLDLIEFELPERLGDLLEGRLLMPAQLGS